MAGTASLRLVEPHARYEASYCGLVREFVERGQPLIPFPLAFPTEDFPSFLARLASDSRGENLPEGFVANSTFWMLRGEEVVGVSNLRHALTDRLRIEGGHIGYGVRPTARRQGVATEILRQTLLRAREHGITEALVTCGAGNEASIRTILRNGGVLASEGFVPERGEIVKRYLVPVPPQG